MPSAATIPPSTKRFIVPKGRVLAIVRALAELQQRTDLSGKFARKLARMRRTLAPIEAGVVEENQITQERHKRKLADGTVVPVFQFNEAGQLVFEKDAQGADTESPVVIPNRFHIVDQAAYDRDMRELAAETIAVECESFTESEFDGFKAIRGDIIDALADLAEDSEFAQEQAEPDARVVGAIGAEPITDCAEERTAP